MNCDKIAQCKKYLVKFNEILCNMSNEMLSQEVTNSITIDFIRCMIPHHQAAIYMCENLLKYTNYPPLQEIAHDIIIMQTRGIEQMREILRSTCGYTNSKEDICCYINDYLTITRNMIYRMKNSPRCANINLDFVGEMIPHHEGAIEMCNNLLRYCIDPRLKIVAENIIKEQSNGVRELKEIQRKICRK